MKLKAYMATAVLSLAVTFAAFAAPIDWESAPAVQKGVRLVHIERTEPRLMKAYMMRIDLKTPGLRFTGTRRDADWGRPMPDYTNGIIRTRRVTTERFLLAERKAGRDMIVAFNSAGWSPWCSPFNHIYGDPGGICITDGIVVSDAPRPKNHLFVAWKDGTCEIRDGIPEDRRADAQVAYRGFDIIMKGGKESMEPSRNTAKALHPRTAYGLSADGRWLYVLAVDGRQEGWSLGADYHDLVEFMRDAGASDAINMDGGGSTTMIYWDGKRVVRVNRHDPKRMYWRKNGVNMGIYIE